MLSDMDVNGLMKGSGLRPTQKEVWEGNIHKYAEAMRKAPGEPGAWDWNWTATNLMEPMIKDTYGNILAGHHRFIAVEAAGVEIPADVVKTIFGSGARVSRPWSSVSVRSGFRPGR